MDGNFKKKKNTLVAMADDEIDDPHEMKQDRVTRQGFLATNLPPRGGRVTSTTYEQLPTARKQAFASC